MGIGLAECKIVDKREVWQLFWPSYQLLGQIFQMRQEGFTLEEIGQQIGRTRERVRQMLAKHYGTIEPKVLSQEEAARRTGCSCDRLTTLREKGIVNPKRRGWLWLYDANELNKAKLAVEADRQYHKPVAQICEQCGKEFEVRRSNYNARLRRRKIPGFFCSRQCYGRYIGLHYGLGVHPERIIGGAKRKWDYSKVYALWEEMRWPLWQLGKVLGIPKPTIYSILQRYPAYVNRARRIPHPRPIPKKLPVTWTTAELRRQLDEVMPEHGLSPELKLYQAIFGQKYRDDKRVLIDVYIQQLHEPAEGEWGEYQRKCVDWVTTILKEAIASDTEAIREPIHNLLDQLTERERRVVWLRFGFENGRSRTLQEVAKEFYVTRERIRQIEAKALRKLRHPSRSRQLRDYLDQNHYLIGQYLCEKVFEECDKQYSPGLFVFWHEDRWALKQRADRQIYAAEEETREMRAKIEELGAKIEELERLNLALKFLTGRLYPHPITEFGVSTRAVNALRRARQWLSDIPTIGELAILSDDELLNIRSFGQKCLLEVKEALVSAGASEWRWQLFTSRFSKIIPVKLSSEKEYKKCNSILMRQP